MKKRKFWVSKGKICSIIPTKQKQRVFIKTIRSHKTESTVKTYASPQKT